MTERLHFTYFTSLSFILFYQLSSRFAESLGTMVSSASCLCISEPLWGAREPSGGKAWSLSLIKFMLIVYCNLFLKIIFLIYLFLAVLGLQGWAGFSLVVVSRGYSLLEVGRFSLQWPLLLLSRGSRNVGFSSLACGLNSCGSRAWLLHGTWDLPGSRMEHVSFALAGRFFITEPPRKPLL